LRSEGECKTVQRKSQLLRLSMSQRAELVQKHKCKRRGWPNATVHAHGPGRRRHRRLRHVPLSGALR